MSIDRTDLLLIRFWQAHPRASYATISRETGISEPTVRRRIESLIERGVVRAAVIPDLTLLGFHTSAIVLLRADQSLLPAIAEQISAFPEVASLGMTLGQYDLVFFVAQSSVEALFDFITNQIAVIPGVRDTQTLITPGLSKVFGDWRIPATHDETALDGKEAVGTDGPGENE